MATSSISGLSSGLDTASLIDQFMQLEAQPQNRLKTQQSSEKAVLTALRSLNTDTSLVANKADALAKPEAWRAFKVTTSGTGVSATASSSASAAGFSFTIDRLATTHQLGFTEPADLDDFVVSGTSVTITGADNVPHVIATGDGTLQDLVTAINDSTETTGVKATAVRVGDGSYRLLAESTATGSDATFTLTQSDGTDLMGGAAVRAGGDAQVSLGLGITATSSTNTFTDLAPGVSVTLDASAVPGSTGRVSVVEDTDTIKSSVKGLVDQLNSLLGSIDSQTAAGTATTNGGVLAGDATARSLRSALLNTVFGENNTSMSSVGIQTDRYGKLVFDGDAFDKAYAADPEAVTAAFTAGDTTSADGWAARVATAAKQASDTRTGTIAAAIEGRNATIDRLTKSIADWDDRLELRRSTLERTYTSLETTLSNLKSQGNWLAGQIGSLPTSSS